MVTGVLAGADWGSIAWAALVALVLSLSRVLREREAQRRARRILTSPLVIVADVITGTVLGVTLSLVVPEWYPRARSLGGVTLLAGIGASLGPSGWQLLAKAALDWFPRLLEAAAANYLKGRGGGDQNAGK